MAPSRPFVRGVARLAAAAVIVGAMQLGAVASAGASDASPQESHRAPTTTITGGPAGGEVVASSAVTFTFSADTTGATFTCQLDVAPEAACEDGTVTYAALENGPHTFRVHAQAGKMAEPSPVTRDFVVAVPAPPAASSPDAGSVPATPTAGVPAPASPAAAPAPPPAAALAPPNLFTIRSAKALGKGRLAVALALPRSGTLALAVSVAGTSKDGAPRARREIAALVLTARNAGTQKATMKLNSTGRRLARKAGGGLTARLTVTYTPHGGTAAMRSRTVTVRGG